MECVSGTWPQSIPLQNQELHVWNWDKPGNIIIIWKSENKVFYFTLFFDPVRLLYGDEIFQWKPGGIIIMLLQGSRCNVDKNE